MYVQIDNIRHDGKQGQADAFGGKMSVVFDKVRAWRYNGKVSRLPFYREVATCKCMGRRVGGYYATT